MVAVPIVFCGSMHAVLSTLIALNNYEAANSFRFFIPPNFKAVIVYSNQSKREQAPPTIVLEIFDLEKFPYNKNVRNFFCNKERRSITVEK